MKNEILIRKATPDDAEEYVKLGILVWRDAYKHIFPEEVFLDKEAKVEGKTKEVAESIAKQSKDEIYYVATYLDKIVGFMNGSLVSGYEYFANKGYADLIALYIHPDYQRKGIAGKFLKIFKEWAKIFGKEKFVIGVLKDNAIGRAVYEKWGGKLSKHSQPFVKLCKEYSEVFYEFDLKWFGIFKLYEGVHNEVWVCKERIVWIYQHSD